MRNVGSALLLAFAPGCAATEQAPTPSRGDYSVYAVVVRHHFLRPLSGEHGLLCADGPPAQLAIGSQTRPLWPRTPRRDSAAAAELPDNTAALVEVLRAMDTLPRRSLAADSLAVGLPVQLHADMVPEPKATTRDESIAQLPEHAPPAIRFSRVAYNADSTLALVYVMQMCQEELEGEVEEGAHGVALLVPLERRAGRWVALDPVYLHVD